MEYKDMPKMIMHMDETDNGNTIEQNADGFMLNGVQYLNQTKVQELINSMQSTIQSWATGQFQPKA